MNPKESRQAYRLPPCPMYDIEGTESWLSSLAEQGLFLSGDGFFCGFGIFDRGEPRPMAYRMEAAQRQPSMWRDDQGAPPEEALTLNRHFGWEYVAPRWQFHIYRTGQPLAREMHTDPAVQALALDRVRRREWGNAAIFLLYSAVYLFFLLRAGVLLTILPLGTLLSFSFILLLLCGTVDTALQLCALRRLRKKLSRGIPPDHRKNWRRHAAAYRASQLLQVFVVISFITLLLHHWNTDVMDRYERPWSGAESVPFATIADLEPGSLYVIDRSGILKNTLEERSHFLAPTMLTLHESGTLFRPDGTAHSCGMRVRYYQTASPALARELYRELLSEAQRSAHYQPLAVTDLPADQSSVYTEYFPTLLLQQGPIVLSAYFYQTGETEPIPLEDWTAACARTLESRQQIIKEREIHR